MNTIDSKLNDSIFDAMLKVACEEVMESKIKEWDEDDGEEHEFSPEFERKMKKLMQSQTRKANAVKAKKALSRAAIVILAIMAAGFTVTMSAEALRVQFFNTITDFAEEYIGFSFRSQTEQPVDTGGVIYPSYVPEGFQIDDTQIMPDAVTIVYRNDDGERIFIDQYVMNDGTNVQIDGEHIGFSYIINIDEIKINVYEGKDDNDSNYITWDDWTTFFLVSGTMQPSELIEMAKSIIFQND